MKPKSIPAVSLKKMAGKNPSFDLPVTIKNLDGDEFVVTFKAQALRKSEYAQKREAYLNAISDGTQRQPDLDEVATAYTSMIGAGVQRAAEYVTQIASGWDLEDDFGEKSLVALEDSCAGSLSAVIAAMDAALLQGRLGN